jgi:FAD/FMN-containing dehydrogenase
LQGTDELNLSKYWHFYHEDQAKWTRLQTIKSRVDPDNVLTPNQFAVTPLGSESL